MARRWTPAEENERREELAELYVNRNLSIREIASLLNMHQATVFDRMKRLGIISTPERKLQYRNKRNDIVLPQPSVKLAEFIGVMLGDGHISRFQTMVTLGTKEMAYVRYVQSLMEHLFGVPATISKKKSGYHDVYIGSTTITTWLREMGLAPNKVSAQVDVPSWIWDNEAYIQAFVRGFFDTDGSVYKLRFGVQISLTNHSIPLLLSLRAMLIALGYKPSEISVYRIYLTRRAEVTRFFKEVQPANTKHTRRFKDLTRR